MTIEFKGQLTRGMYVKALRTASRGLRFFGVLMFLGGVYGLFEYFQTRQIVWGVPLFFMLWGIFLFFSPEISARRLLAGPLLRDPFTGSADEEGFRFQSAHSNSDIDWPSFFRGTITKELVMLYTSPAQFYVLAPEFFATTEEWQSFSNLVVSRVRLKKASRSPFMIMLVWIAIIIVTFLLWSLFGSR